MNNITKNFSVYFSYLVLLVAFLFSLAYSYYSFYPFKILEFENTDAYGNGVYEVLTKEVKRGDSMQYRSVFTKLMDYPSLVSCYWEDGIIFRTVTQIADNPLGRSDFIRQVIVPETLPPGEYRYVCQIQYKLTMQRTIDYTFYTDYFNVVE